MSRKNVSSGSHLEKPIGFSRAVRIGNFISVSGTAPIVEGGETAYPNDVYMQTKYCIDIMLNAIHEAGGQTENVIRTRIMLTNIKQWELAAKAHGEAFSDVKPACTFVEVSRFINTEWLVETEADCVLEEQ